MKVPVKIELAKTQQYSANTGEKRCHNSSGVPGNEVVGASGSASEIQAGVKLSEDAPNYGSLLVKTGLAARLV